MVMPAVLLGGMLSIATPFVSESSAIAPRSEVNFLVQAPLDPETPPPLDPRDRLFLANITNPQDAVTF